MSITNVHNQKTLKSQFVCRRYEKIKYSDMYYNLTVSYLGFMPISPIPSFFFFFFFNSFLLSQGSQIFFNYFFFFIRDKRCKAHELDTIKGALPSRDQGRMRRSRCVQGSPSVAVQPRAKPTLHQHSVYRNHLHQHTGEMPSSWLLLTE